MVTVPKQERFSSLMGVYGMVMSVCPTVITYNGGQTLVQRYETTMAKLEQITRAGYEVEIQWECEFDKHILPLHPELLTDPMVLHSPLNTRDSLYGDVLKL
jgi:hypothetical protein